MINLKKIELLGNVASIQQFETNDRISIIVSEYKGNENGEAKYETTWASMFVDKETSIKYGVGDLLCIHGGFTLSTYTATLPESNKKEPRISLTIYPDSIKILSKKRQETNDLPEGDNNKTNN